MLAALEGMTAELRQSGAPAPLAGRIDAVHSLRHLPVADRDTVKAALRAVLVKTHDHELAFDTVFDLYFAAQAAADPNAPQNAPPTSQGGGAGPDGRGAGNGPGNGNGQGFGSLGEAALSELLLTALREGNEPMLRALAAIFVDRYAGFEPGRPVAGTYYVFRTLRAVDPDRLLARLAEPGETTVPALPIPGEPLLRRLGMEGYEAQLARVRRLVEAPGPPPPGHDPRPAAAAPPLPRPPPAGGGFPTSS